MWRGPELPITEQSHFWNRCCRRLVETQTGARADWGCDVLREGLGLWSADQAFITLMCPCTHNKQRHFARESLFSFRVVVVVVVISKASKWEQNGKHLNFHNMITEMAVQRLPVSWVHAMNRADCCLVCTLQKEKKDPSWQGHWIWFWTVWKQV